MSNWWDEDFIECFNPFSSLSIRVQNALKEADIKTIDDLRASNPKDLLRLPKMGRKGVDGIKAFLRECDAAIAADSLK